MSNSQAKRNCLKLCIVGLSVGLIYLATNCRTLLLSSSSLSSPLPPPSSPPLLLPSPSPSPPPSPPLSSPVLRRPRPPAVTTVAKKASSKSVQTHPRAYIIAADCHSARFNATKKNLERGFPGFFDIHCFVTVPFNDSRIQEGELANLFKKWWSNLLGFVDLWTYVIPAHSADDLDWSFVFEDDVNICQAASVSLDNFIAPLQHFMSQPEVQVTDGFFYLGLCGPEFKKKSRVIVAPDTNNTLVSKRGYGYCLHATAITARRARIFWGEIAAMRPHINDKSLDFQLRDYSLRSKNEFYTFGSNFQYPYGTGHYGVAFQDRGHYPSTVS